MKTVFIKNFTLTFVSAFCFLFYSCSRDVVDELLENIESNKKVEKKDSEDQKASDGTWDWTKPESYDFAYSMIGGKKNISSPFHTTASADTRLTDIIMARDYLPEQGWVLLAKVFGSPNDYIQSAV